MIKNNISENKKQIIKNGQKLGEKNIKQATYGNISIRTGENNIITGSGTCLADLNEEKIV